MIKSYWIAAIWYSCIWNMHMDARIWLTCIWVYTYDNQVYDTYIWVHVYDAQTYDHVYEYSHALLFIWFKNCVHDHIFTMNMIIYVFSYMIAHIWLWYMIINPCQHMITYMSTPNPHIRPTDEMEAGEFYLLRCNEQMITWITSRFHPGVKSGYHLKTNQ